MIPTVTWVLPRPRKNKYKGGFPLHFEKKLIRDLGFDEIKDKMDIFHPFGGCAEFGLRNDLNIKVKPDFSLDAHNLIGIENNSFRLVILDPPYNRKYSRDLYEMPPPKFKKYMEEAIRITKGNGYIAMYHYVLTPRQEKTKLIKRYVILTRTWHIPRVCCIFQKID